MQIEKIEKNEHGLLKPTITVIFECVDQQEFDAQVKVMEHIQDTRLLAVVDGYREQ